MTSGEWDLRALKALEEEEQKEFLALSQRSLFEPTASSATTSSPPAGQQNKQQQPHQTPPLSYAQLHPHLLKLPTINECQLIAKRQQLQNAAASNSNNGSTLGRLKFTRALSLSAHSLSGRSAVGGGGYSSGGGGGGAAAFVGSFFGAAARKTKARFVASKSIGSLSPPAPQYSISPVYTPPPVRRCATLHHTQPVRKTFKTLQQLERQKHESQRHKESQQQASHKAQANSNSTLQRVVGTNKTYWKYGANSTAASIIGQRSRKQCAAAELESNTSDDLGGSSEEANGGGAARFLIGGSASGALALNDFDDNATETGSCSVPLLATDTNEMMRLMLTSATTAVSSAAALPQQMTANYLPAQHDFVGSGGVIAATGGVDNGRNQHQIQLLQQQQYDYRTLARCYPFANEETVAYEAFHGQQQQQKQQPQQQRRRKSFSGRTAEQELSSSNVGNRVAATAMRAGGAVNNRKMLKATSVDAAPLGMEMAAAAGIVGGITRASGAATSAAIITNSIVEGIKTTVASATATTTAAAKTTTSATTIKPNHMCNLAKTTKAAGGSSGCGGGSGGAIGTTIGCGGMHFNDVLLNEPHQQHQQQQQHTASTSLRKCQDVANAAAAAKAAVVMHNGGGQHSPTSPLSSSSLSPAAHLMDDELEQHIKHCSCSCNHMGYGNSMDYQTTGFGGLPDVTEHSNIRRTLSRQNSISNSDSGGEIASIQKSKINFGLGSVVGIGAGNGSGGDTKSTAATSAHHHLHHHLAHGTATPNAKRKSKAAHATQGDGSGTMSGHGVGGGVRNKTQTMRVGSYLVGLTLIAALGLLAVAATLAYQHFLMSPSRNSHAQRLRIVRSILREVPLVDGHNNFAWNVRRYAHSSLELVSHLSHNLNHGGGDEDDQHGARGAMWQRPAWAQTDMDRLRQGLVGVQVWSAYVPCEAQGLDAVQLALEQIDIIRRLTEMYSSQTTLVTNSADMLAAHKRGLMASLIGIEGGHTIGSSLGVLRSFYSLGARYLSLTHKCDVTWAGSAAGGRSATSALESNGLTAFGKAIVREMNRLGMMIDLSYSSDATARDVLEVTRAPVIFSHSAARHLCNSTRNIPDEILRMVAENGGLIMISFDSEDVACSSRGGGRPARLADVIAHINYVRTIAGIQHIGLGAGYDGIEVPPVGLEDVSKYPDLLATLLEDHNWSEEHIKMLAGRNFLRIMEAVENVREYWKRAAIQPIEQTEPQPKTQCTYMAS